MKTLSQILPAKKITIIQTLICFVLIIAICALSFGTVFSLHFEPDKEFQTQINELAGLICGESDIELDLSVKVDVSFPFLISSIGSAFDILGAVIGFAQDAGQNPDFDIGAAGGEVLNKIQNPDFLNLLIFIALLLLSFATNIIVGLCNVLLVIATFILPMTTVIAAIRAVLGLLCNTKDMGKAFHKVSRAFYSIISIFPILLLVMLVVPEVRFGSAVYGIIACCAVGLAINLIASRLKTYDGEDLRYVNLLQIACFVSLLGYLLFFFNIMRSDIVSSAYFALAGETGGGVGFVLTVILLIGVFTVVGRVSKILTRLSCMAKGRSDAHVKSAIFSLLVVILPFVMQGMNIGFEIADGAMPAFILCCIGVVMMAAAELVIALVPKSLCPNMTAVRRREIATGAYAPAAPVEEAPAAEAAPAEEAPAEETV